MRERGVSAVISSVALLSLLTGGVLLEPAVATEPGARQDGKVRVEVPPTLNGRWGRYAEVPAQSPEVASHAGPSDTTAAVDGAVTQLGATGPTDSRVDVVVMGDGYTEAEQDKFVEDATARLHDLLAIEPYASYRGLMNLWVVHAVSVDSGVSRDFDTNPGAVQDKDTALGAYFWCNGTERLLCIDAPSVDAYAQLAPAADLVVVVANSQRYGGAGYHHGYGGDLGEEYEYSGISTLSSGHWASHLVAAHEIGHSLGGLADEYFYCSEPGFEAYCIYYGFWNGELYWGEVPEPNVTIYGPGAGYGAGYLIENSYKWFRWLGEADPSGGTVGMHDGGRYFASGIYRPTADSIMKSLANTNFNLPGTEAMLAGFYTYGELLSADLTGTTVRPDEKVTISVADVGGLAALSDIRWYVDGREARQARGKTTVIPQRLGVPSDGLHELSVAMSDDTPSIRDPQIREQAQTSLSWTVSR